MTAREGDALKSEGEGVSWAVESSCIRVESGVESKESSGRIKILEAASLLYVWCGGTFCASWWNEKILPFLIDFKRWRDLRKELRPAEEMAAEGATEVCEPMQEDGGDGRIVLGSIGVGSNAVDEDEEPWPFAESEGDIARKGSLPRKMDEPSSSEVSIETILPLVKGKWVAFGGQGKVKMSAVASSTGLGVEASSVVFCACG